MIVNLNISFLISVHSPQACSVRFIQGVNAQRNFDTDQKKLTLVRFKLTLEQLDCICERQVGWDRSKRRKLTISIATNAGHYR